MYILIIGLGNYSVTSTCTLAVSTSLSVLYKYMYNTTEFHRGERGGEGFWDSLTPQIASI